MPRLSRYFLRASLLYMLLGFTVGSLILMQKAIAFAPSLWAWLPVHVESVFIGWMTQFALGIAFWILPRLGPTRPRGNEIWSWGTFLLLNAGIWIGWIPVKGAAFLGCLMESMAILLFFLGNWPRLYPSPWARNSPRNAKNTNASVHQDSSVN